MFKALEPSNETVELDNFEETLIESLEHSIEIQTLRSEISDLISTGADLEQLYVAIKQNGISASLMAFANRNNVLSKSIPSIPSLESLTTDISVEDSKAALEGISNVLKQIYQKTLGKISTLINHVLTSLKIRARSIPAMRLRIDNYIRDISGKEFDVEKAHKITGKFQKYTNLLELIDHAANANHVTMELLEKELPTTEEQFVKFKAELEEFKKKHGQNYKIDNSFKYNIVSSASLIDNGYTADSFHVIATKLDEYIRAVLSSETAKETAWKNYEDRLEKALEAMTATYEDHKGQEQTAYTKMYSMLVDLADDICSLEFDIDVHSFRDGPVKALKTLNLLKQAYK